MHPHRRVFEACRLGALGCLTTTLLLPKRDLAQDSRRFPPDPLCAPRLAHSPTLDVGALAAGHGDFFVQLRSWGDTDGLRGGTAWLAALVSGREGWTLQTTDSGGLGQHRDSGGLYPFTKRPAGLYLLTARRIGYLASQDTVVIRPGGSDTLVIAMERDVPGSANAHNCRPHHFRAPWEPACLADTVEERNLRNHALHFAKSPSDRKLFKLPAFEPSDVAVVQDTAICEAAATAYGAGTRDPPRRVVVVRAGPVYFVFDPREPLRGGEFEITLVLDRHFHVIMGLAG